MLLKMYCNIFTPTAFWIQSLKRFAENTIVAFGSSVPGLPGITILQQPVGGAVTFGGLFARL